MYKTYSVSVYFNKDITITRKKFLSKKEKSHTYKTSGEIVCSRYTVMNDFNTFPTLENLCKQIDFKNDIIYHYFSKKLIVKSLDKQIRNCMEPYISGMSYEESVPYEKAYLKTRKDLLSDMINDNDFFRVVIKEAHLSEEDCLKLLTHEEYKALNSKGNVDSVLYEFYLNEKWVDKLLES